MGKMALIVADMLNDFIDPRGSLYVGPQGREIIPFVARKIEEIRAAGGVVIFVCDAHAPDDKEFKLLRPPCRQGQLGRGDHSGTARSAGRLPGGKDQLQRLCLTPTWTTS